MLRPRLLVTRKLPDRVGERLDAYFDVVQLDNGDPPSTADVLQEAASGVDAILLSPTEKINSQSVVDLSPTIKAIATFSVGYEHLDIEALSARGISVSNTPDVLTEATADIALLCLLGAARRAREAQSRLQASGSVTWSPTGGLGLDLAGRKFGVLGFGRIGRATARRAQAFGMEIMYWNRSDVPDHGIDGACAVATPEALCEAADVLSLHSALTADTREILSADLIARLPADGIVVNTARGELIDEAALLAALDEDRLFAAGLDVFTGEPDVNPDLLRHPRIFALPHVGSATRGTREKMGMCAADNLISFFETGRMTTGIN